MFYNGKYFSFEKYISGLLCSKLLKMWANVMSLLLMSLFRFQASRDGVNRDLGEAVPRLPGETRITGKDPMKLVFA